MSLFEFKKFEHPKTESVTLSSVPEKDEGNVQRAVQNLVTHIPGEATGFYMLAIAFYSAAVTVLANAGKLK